MNYIQIFLSESGIHLRDQSGKQANLSNQNWDAFINQTNLFQICQGIHVRITHSKRVDERGEVRTINHAVTVHIRRDDRQRQRESSRQRNAQHSSGHPHAASAL